MADVVPLYGMHGHKQRIVLYAVVLYVQCNTILRLPEIIRAMPCTPRLPVSECLCRWLFQEESAQLQRQLSAEHERSVILQRDLSVSLRDSKEGLFREKEIISQLEAQDEVCNTSATAKPCTCNIGTCICNPSGFAAVVLPSCCHYTSMATGK